MQKPLSPYLGGNQKAPGGRPEPAPYKPAPAQPSPPKTQAPAAAEPAKENYGTGIKLQEVNQSGTRCLQVIRLTNGSSATLSGMISVGDLLTKIDGFVVDGDYDASVVRSMLTGMRGSRVSLRLVSSYIPKP